MLPSNPTTLLQYVLSPILLNEYFTHSHLFSKRSHRPPLPQSCLPLPSLPRPLSTSLPSRSSLHSKDTPNSFFCLRAFKSLFPSNWNAPHPHLHKASSLLSFSSPVSAQMSNSQRGFPCNPKMLQLSHCLAHHLACLSSKNLSTSSTVLSLYFSWVFT